MHGSQVGAGLAIVLIVLAIWTIYWKIRALWRSARLGHKGWFAFFFIFNLLGIPEIIYIKTHPELQNTTQQM